MNETPLWLWTEEGLFCAVVAVLGIIGMVLA